MPVCPKCGRLISDKNYGRHLRRHGTHHRHEPTGIDIPSATPSWEGVNRGIRLGPHSKWSRWQKAGIYLVVALGLGIVGLLFLLGLILRLL